MTVHKVLADIVEALRTSHLEHEIMRAEMATKQELGVLERSLAVVDQKVTKLGIDFEAFRHDTRITLDMLSELMGRTSRHETDLATLNNRVGRVERHIKLRPLPDSGDR